MGCWPEPSVKSPRGCLNRAAHSVTVSFSQSEEQSEGGKGEEERGSEKERTTKMEATVSL